MIAALAVALTVAVPAPGLETLVAQRVERFKAPLSEPQVKRLTDAVVVASGTYDVPATLILAVIERESAYFPQAVSRVGCVGLMQLASRTAVATKPAAGLRYMELRRIEHNIMVGTAYLAQLYAAYGRWDRALTAYSAGPGILKKRRMRPNQYAQDVLKRWRFLRTLLSRTA